MAGRGWTSEQLYSVSETACTDHERHRAKQKVPQPGNLPVALDQPVHTQNAQLLFGGTLGGSAPAESKVYKGNRLGPNGPHPDIALVSTYQYPSPIVIYQRTNQGVHERHIA